MPKTPMAPWETEIRIPEHQLPEMHVAGDPVHGGSLLQPSIRAYNQPGGYATTARTCGSLLIRRSRWTKAGPARAGGEQIFNPEAEW